MLNFDKKCSYQSSISTGCIAVLVVFLLSRAYYYFDLCKYQFSRTDNTAMMAVQKLYNTSNYFAHQMYLFRSPNERLMMRIIAYISSISGVAVYNIYLALSAFVFILSTFLIYFFFINFFKTKYWSFIFLLLITQSTYYSWLSYPLYLPKMWGFAFYPFILYFAVCCKLNKRLLFYYFLSLFLLSLLYMPSVFYFSPFLSIVLLYRIYKSQATDKLEKKYLYVHYVIGCAVLLSFYSIMYFFSSIHQATTIKIAEYMYYNYFGLHFSEIIYQYFHSFGAYIILASISYFYINFMKPAKLIYEKQTVNILFFLSITQVLFGVFTQYLSTMVGFFRLFLIWRASYFAYFSVILLVVMALHTFFVNLKIRYKLSVMLIPINIIFISIILFFLQFTNTQSSIWATYKYTNTENRIKAINPWYIKAKGVISYIKNTPKDSSFLMPELPISSDFDAIIQAETGRATLLGPLYRGYFSVEGTFTNRLYNGMKFRSKIYKMRDNKQFTSLLCSLARDFNASYIITPANRDLTGMQCVYSDKFWSVWRVKY